MTRSEDDWFEREQLHFAADEGDLERVRALVDEGYDVNAFDSGLSLTPLHYAARGGHLQVARFLIEAGADVNAHDENRIGETPLGEVASNCSYAMAELLIDAGADPTLPGWMGISALDRSRERKKAEGRRVRELLEKTAAQKFRHKA